MKTAEFINGLKGRNITPVISTIENLFNVVRVEKVDKNIVAIYLDDKDVNSVTLYIMANKVEKISFNYNN